MMGRLNHDQGELFYSFCLEKVVPDDHLVRKIAAFLDLAWVRVELSPTLSQFSTVSGCSSTPRRIDCRPSTNLTFLFTMAA
jgi:hypothetical protein